MLRLDPTDPRKTKVEGYCYPEKPFPAGIWEANEAQVYGWFEWDGKRNVCVWDMCGNPVAPDKNSCVRLRNAPEPPVTREVWAVIHADGQVIAWYGKPTQDDIKFSQIKGVQRLTISVTPGKFDL